VVVGDLDLDLIEDGVVEAERMEAGMIKTGVLFEAGMGTCSVGKKCQR
jgi:hypothetical protein